MRPPGPRAAPLSREPGAEGGASAARAGKALLLLGGRGWVRSGMMPRPDVGAQPPAGVVQGSSSAPALRAVKGLLAAQFGQLEAPPSCTVRAAVRNTSVSFQKSWQLNLM